MWKIQNWGCSAALGLETNVESELVDKGNFVTLICIIHISLMRMRNCITANVPCEKWSTIYFKIGAEYKLWQFKNHSNFSTEVVLRPLLVDWWFIINLYYILTRLNWSLLQNFRKQIKIIEETFFIWKLLHSLLQIPEIHENWMINIV